MWWWGYLHISGSVQVKRYFDSQDIREANQSDFVVATTGKFEAAGRQDALKQATEFLLP